MAVKKVKKISKAPVVEEPILPEIEADPFDVELDEEDFDLPYHMKHDHILKERKEEDELSKLRTQEIKAFKCPNGYSIVTIVEHSYLDDEEQSRTALKEQIFWSRYKPQFEYELTRPGKYSTIIIRKPLDKPLSTKGR